MHGKLKYSRNILIPADAESGKRLFELDGVKSIAPLDCALGIAHLPFKMTVDLMLRCAYWAQNQCSYQEAEEALLEASHVLVNDDTIRLVTNFIGNEVFKEDCARVDAVFEQYDSGKLEFPASRKGTLYIEADGAALNTRHKDADGSTWRENKLGIIFSTDNIHFWKNKKGERVHQIRSREYVSYIGEAQEFKRHLFAAAVRNGYGTYRETVIISDGAPWIAHIADELFPDAQRILDLFHLKENVYDYAKARFGMDESKYIPWAKEICQNLEDGHWKDVLARLNPDEKYSNCVNLYHYINENKNAINYPEYKEKGYFVGSGAIESSNKTVLQKRLKQAGMRWEPETAQYLLTLRSKQESGRWQSDVVDFIHKKFEDETQSR